MCNYSVYKKLDYLYERIFPEIQTYGFDFADSRQVAVHPWTVQTHKDTKSVGRPVRICEYHTRISVIYSVFTVWVWFRKKNVSVNNNNPLTCNDAKTFLFWGKVKLVKTILCEHTVWTHAVENAVVPLPLLKVYNPTMKRDPSWTLIYSSLNVNRIIQMYWITCSKWLVSSVKLTRSSAVSTWAVPRLSHQIQQDLVISLQSGHRWRQVASVRLTAGF